jgi:hypothetical protein
MVESVCSSAIKLGLAFSKQYSSMPEADFVCVKLSSLAKNVAYALQEALEQGALESASESYRQNLDMTHGLLKQLEAWTENYMKAGRNSGRLGRLCGYFCAGMQVDVLKKICEDIDQAVKAMGMVVRMEMCAGVKDMIEQQSSIACIVVEELKQQHAGRPDDLLAARIAKMTTIPLADVQRELNTSMAALQSTENRSKYIKDDILHGLSRHMGNMKIATSVDPGEDLAACLEFAPLSMLEWVQEQQGMCKGELYHGRLIHVGL